MNMVYRLWYGHCFYSNIILLDLSIGMYKELWPPLYHDTIGLLWSGALVYQSKFYGNNSENIVLVYHGDLAIFR